jgi:hypothetical protein
MKKATITVGETVWTMTYTHNRNGTITIQNFDSEDNDGYMFAEQFGKIESIVESEGRVAEAVIIDGDRFEVANRQNVFTYKQPL